MMTSCNKRFTFTITILHVIELIVLLHHVNCEKVSISTLGTVIGSTAKTYRTNETIYQFLGVRYAEAPSGSNRLKVCLGTDAIIKIKNAQTPYTEMESILTFLATNSSKTMAKSIKCRKKWTAMSRPEVSPKHDRRRAKGRH